MSHLGRSSLHRQALLLGIAALASAACARVDYGNRFDANAGGAPGGIGNGGANDHEPGNSGGSSTVSSGGTSISDGGAVANGGSGDTEPGEPCRPGDLDCGSWQSCALEFSIFDSIAKTLNTNCSGGSRISAVALPSQDIDGLDTRFELIASPIPNIMIAGPTQIDVGASLYSLPPDLSFARGSTFQSADATQADTLFLRRGGGGRTFLIGTIDGYLFQSGKKADVFVVAANAANQQTEWSTQFGSDKSDCVHGATATKDGGLAAVGTLGPAEDENSKRMLWLWDKKGTLTGKELKFSATGAIATGFDSDAQGYLYLITSPRSGLYKLASTGEVQSITPLDEALDCTYCQTLAVTHAGASYLLGTREIANAKVELRLSRHDVDGKLTWSHALGDNLTIASLFAGGNHVIAVGTLLEPNSSGTGVLLELDQDGTPVRQLRFGRNLSVLSASRTDSGRVDVLVRLPASSESRLVQLAPP
jgi:hypothetical protein